MIYSPSRHSILASVIKRASHGSRGWIKASCSKSMRFHKKNIHISNFINTFLSLLLTVAHGSLLFMSFRWLFRERQKEMFWRMSCLLLSMLGESHLLTLVLFCPSGAAAGGEEALWEHGAAARWAVVRWIQTRSQLAEEHRRDPGPRGVKDQKHFLNCGAHSRITNLSMFGLASTSFLEQSRDKSWFCLVFFYSRFFPLWNCDDSGIVMFRVLWSLVTPRDMSHF